MGLIMRNRECYTGKVRETNPLEWKYLGSKTGGAELSLPTEDYTELLVEVEGIYSNPGSIYFSGIVRKEVVNSQVNIGGYLCLGVSSSSCCLCNKTATTIKANQVYVNGSNVSSASVMTVYYR